MLVAEIGADAEAEVLRDCSCDRAATYPGLGDPVVTFVDHFTGAAGGVAREELRTFAAVTVANELDVADHLDAASRGERHRAIAPLADLLTAAGRADLERTLT